MSRECPNCSAVTFRLESLLGDNLYEAVCGVCGRSLGVWRDEQREAGIDSGGESV